MGVYTYLNGSVYDGDWKGEMKDGWGVFTYDTGDRYEGAWV